MLTNVIVVCDFDGTIIKIDTAEYILNRFAEGDWHSIDGLFEMGKINLEECMTRQFELIKLSGERIIEEIDKVAVERDHFHQFIHYCKGNGARVMIVSGGLDFYIRHFLRKNGLRSGIEVIAPKSPLDPMEIRFTFPKLYYKNSKNFKEDIVNHLKNEGNQVVFIGDGAADFPAALVADRRFAVSGSRLAFLLKERDLEHGEFSDFQEIVKASPLPLMHTLRL